MKCLRWDTLPIKYLSSLILLLIVPTLLLSSACSPPPPPAPPPPPPNEPPIINSLIAEKEVATLTESQITCQATDADGDVLSYQWSADGGTIKGEGSSINWVAPDTAGNYTVKVTVTDGKGGEATDSTNVAVIYKPNEPPTITGLTIDGNPLGKENLIRQWTTKTIQCTAQDPDGDNLNYLWRATGGKITGEGNTVSWTSPGVNGDYTITVIVTDGRDGSAEASIVFEVLCCGGGRI
jgi:hypothetical protein